MDIREIIKQLGGPTAISRVLGIGVGAVSHWWRRGRIPPEHFLALGNRAKALGIAWRPEGWPVEDIPTAEGRKRR